MNSAANKPNRKIIFKKIQEWTYITLGVALAAFSFSFFLNVNNIVIGGGSGLGVIFKDLFGIDPAWTVLILNVALLIAGTLTMGKNFFIKTAYGSLSYPLFVKLFNWIYEISGLDFSAAHMDMVLVILFSSIIMGLGLGLVVKAGATTGGTEVGQQLLLKYLHIPYSTSLYALDGLVIFMGLIAGVASVEYTLYAVVFTYLCGVVIDSVVFTGMAKRAVYIISHENEAIKKELLEKFERGVTSIRVVGEYSKQNREMLVCVLSAGEYFRLREIIAKYDPKAFFYSVKASEVRGEGFTYER